MRVCVTGSFSMSDTGGGDEMDILVLSEYTIFIQERQGDE